METGRQKQEFKGEQSLGGADESLGVWNEIFPGKQDVAGTETRGGRNKVQEVRVETRDYGQMREFWETRGSKDGNERFQGGTRAWWGQE